jgi:hypothetical protein
MTPYTEEGIEAKAALAPEPPKDIAKVEANPLDDPSPAKLLTLQRRLSDMETKEKMQHGQSEGQEGGSKDKGKRKVMKCKEYYTYKLVGVVIHNGNADAGHYYSYINVARGERERSEDYLHTERDRWVQFNDSIITEFNFTQLEAESFGGTQEDIGAGYMEDSAEIAKLLAGRSKSAYMLIYERRHKTPIPERIRLANDTDPIVRTEADLVVSSLECDSTALSRAEKENLRLIWQDTAGATYRLHPFHKVPQYMPESIIAVSPLYERRMYIETTDSSCLSG